LHTLREVSLRETHGALRRDLGRLRQAAYAASFVEQATETETPLPAVFELMREFLAGLCRHPSTPQTVLAFELKLLHEFGLKPDLEETKLTPGTKQIVRALMQVDWSACLRLKPTPAQAGELRRFLHGFLIFHLGRLPKGRSQALAMQPDGED
jgi:recombinational DNA repair protein (RecF pathway)